MHFGTEKKNVKRYEEVCQQLRDLEQGVKMQGREIKAQGREIEAGRRDIEEPCIQDEEQESEIKSLQTEVAQHRNILTALTLHALLDDAQEQITGAKGTNWHSASIAALDENEVAFAIANAKLLPEQKMLLSPLGDPGTLR
ncbi:hypothetical protein AX17_005270 [Amanita inopinata Kibby_2008]|nr:hypothetical protein AX17_005270 [Amanita inopinata Kibby_2008]